MIINITDFTGKYEIHSGLYDQSKLQNYIDIYEKRYLIELFGATLYNEFISDLDPFNVPESPNFLVIYNPFEIDTNVVSPNQILISEGIKQMLKGFIYFEYLKDTTNQTTPNGMVIPSNENSTTATTLYSMIYTRYNEAIRTYRSIQYYIITNYNAPIGQLLNIALLTDGNGYDGYYWLSNLTQGTGTGGVIEFTSYGINGIRVFTPSSVGSGYTNGNIYPLFGIGGATVRVFTTPSGVPTNIEIIEPGSGYSIGDILTIDGGNNDQTITVTAPLGNGEIQSIGIYAAGSGYSVNDVFTLASNTHPNTGTLGTAKAVKVGKGDFSKFNGIRKNMVYWL
jgi:hypothetical protein